MAYSGEFANIEAGLLNVPTLNFAFRTIHSDVRTELLTHAERALAFAPVGSNVASFTVPGLENAHVIAILKDVCPAPFMSWAIIHNEIVDDPQGNFGDELAILSSVVVGMNTLRVRTMRETITRARGETWPTPTEVPRILIGGSMLAFSMASRFLRPAGENANKLPVIEKQIKPIDHMIYILGTYCTAVTYNPLS